MIAEGPVCVWGGTHAQLGHHIEGERKVSRDHCPVLLVPQPNLLGSHSTAPVLEAEKIAHLTRTLQGLPVFLSTVQVSLDDFPGQSC